MCTRIVTATKQDMLNRIRGEYQEMPGLGLKLEQARRLWNLDESHCAELLDSLVEMRFLQRRTDGRYVRAGGERDSRASTYVAAAINANDDVDCLERDHKFANVGQRSTVHQS